MQHPPPAIERRQAVDVCGLAGLCGFHPNLPVTGRGPVFNLGQGDLAVSNASAHVAWALVVPLLGERLWGRRGKWAMGVTWLVVSLLQEALFHSPSKPGPLYPSEVRTDLLTKLAPTVFVLAVF